MITAQTPLPDPSALADLPESVALAFLALAGLITIGTLFGGAIRDRISNTPPSATPPPPTGDGAHALTPAPAAALVSARADTDRLIAHLEARVAALERTVDDREREIASAERRIIDLERLIDDLRRGR